MLFFVFNCRLYITGDIDYFVPPPLTTLRGMEPTPLNLSAPDIKPVPIVSAFKPKGGFVNYFFQRVKNCLIYAHESLTSRLNSKRFDANGLNDTCNASFDGNLSMESDENVVQEVDLLVNNTFSPRIRQLLSLKQETWDADMLTHIQPQHISVRTSMLQSVGFQVDHLAILWCRQVLSAVHKILNQLSEIPSAHKLGPDGKFHTVQLPFKFTGEANSPDDDPSLWFHVPDDRGDAVHILSGVIKRRYLNVGRASSRKLNTSRHNLEFIPPVAAIMRRNSASALWKLAAKDERRTMIVFFDNATFEPNVGWLHSLIAYIIQYLQLGWLAVAAVIFVSHRLQTICLMYSMVCCLALIVPVLDRLSFSSPCRKSKKDLIAGLSPSALSDWLVVASPGVHLFTNFWIRACAAAAGVKVVGGLCGHLWTGYPCGKMSFLSLQTRALLNVFIPLIIVIGLFYQFGRAKVDVLDFIQVIGPALEWTASYGLALILWVVFGVSLLAARSAVHVLFVPVRWVYGFVRGPKTEPLDVDTIRKARVAATAASLAGPPCVSIWAYLVGADKSHQNIVKRPPPFHLIVLAICPFLLMAIVHFMSGSLLGLSLLFKILCASNVAFFSLFIVLWFITALIPPASARAPQWFCGSAINAPAIPYASQDYVLTLAAAITWPVAVLAFPSFEFSVAVLFDDVKLLKFISACVGKIGLTRFSEFLEAEYFRLTDLHSNLQSLSDVFGLFGPGLIYVTATLYFCIVFLILSRR